MDFCVKDIPCAGEYDLLIAGSGMGGITAAAAAAEDGLKVGMIEAFGEPGGIPVNGRLGSISGYSRKGAVAVGGFARQFANELLRRGKAFEQGGGSNINMTPPALCAFLLELLDFYRIDLHLYTQLIGAESADGKITHAVIARKNGISAMKAKLFVDATGDGDLGALSGASFDAGSPEDGHFQPMSMLAVLTGIRLQEILRYVNGYTPRAEAVNNLHDLLTAHGAEPTYHDATLFHLSDELFLLMANHEYRVSGCDADDLTRAAITARREIHSQIAALRRSGPEWKRLTVAATAERIGVREGRRIRGLYQVSLADLLEGRSQPDAICHVKAGIDIHALKPSFSNGFADHKYKARPYDIPLRSLISADIPNLILTGRCISGDFYAHASYRVTGNMVPLGEAAGVLAALAVRENLSPAQVPYELVRRTL